MSVGMYANTPVFTHVCNAGMHVQVCIFFRIHFMYKTEAVSGQSKETALVIYLAFLAKVANLYYMILTAFKKYWPYTVAKFASGTQDRFI